MNNPEAFKEDEVRSIKFVVPGLPFGKQLRMIEQS